MLFQLVYIKGYHGTSPSELVLLVWGGWWSRLLIVFRGRSSLLATTATAGLERLVTTMLPLEYLQISSKTFPAVLFSLLTAGITDSIDTTLEILPRCNIISSHPKVAACCLLLLSAFVPLLHWRFAAGSMINTAQSNPGI